MIYITADSTCDLPRERIEKHHITLMPLTVTLGGKDYRDGVDLQADEIYRHYDKTHELPKTAAGSPAAYEELFRSLTAGGNQVIHIGLSEKFSSSYANATLAAGQVPGAYTVDSRSLSTGSGLLVLEAAEMAEAGTMDAAQIAQVLRKRAYQSDASFILDDLEYLHAGGRCSSVARLGANLLSLKPCIEVRDGAMGVGSKYRGNFEKCLMNYIRARLENNADRIDPKRVFITHSGMDDDTRTVP